MILCHGVLFCLLMPAANQISKVEMNKTYSLFFFLYILKTTRHQSQPETKKLLQNITSKHLLAPLISVLIKQKHTYSTEELYMLNRYGAEHVAIKRKR